MKKRFSQTTVLFLTLFLFISTFGYAQYDDVDDKVRTYPKSFTSAEKLAERINADFKKEAEKARAIFTWEALNIRYDLNAYYTLENNGVAYSYTTLEDKIRKEKIFRQALVKKTLKTGKAVCEGYASLFAELCTLTGLQAVIIPGTSKSHQSQIGKLPRASDHAWNAVKIDGKWQLVDITWASGIVNPLTKKFQLRFNDAYFFTDPEKFFLNHYPDDERWLLVDKSAEDFAVLPFYYPEYLKSNYVLSADEGHILFPKNVAVKFNIKNLKPNDALSYITGGNNMLEPLAVDNENNFIIYPSPYLFGYLTIFVNEKPLVAYKIVKR